VRQHALKLRGEHGQGALGARKALGIGQRADGRLHLLVREHEGDTRAAGVRGREPPAAI